jgi:ankyrin repeat protein
MGAQLSAVRGRRVAAGAVVALAAVLAALLRRAMAGRRLERGSSNPHPRELSASFAPPVGDYATCLDREWVQKEIRWALKHGKKIITIYEGGMDNPGYFDMRKAVERYKGTEWEDILNIDAIPYRPGGHEQEAMLKTLFDRATGAKPITRTRGSPKNKPGKWEFFLSHHVALGGHQVSTLHVLLEKVNKRAAWYDKDVTDASEDAMEEGVRCSKYFVLFLTSNPSAQSGAAVDNGPVPLSPQQQPAPASESEPEPPVDLSALCKTQSASQQIKPLDAYAERRGLREDVVSWVQRDTGHELRACLVLGEPGSGKTTLLTHLCRHDAFRSAVLAQHFCQAAREDTLKPATFVRNIVKQLYRNAPEYRAHVDADRELHEIVKRILEDSRDGEQAQDKDQPLRDLTDGVLEPLKAVYPGAARPHIGHVLVVDSLDEALLPFKQTTHTEGRSIVYLLKKCYATGLFPEWMKVLATSRRDVSEVGPAQLSDWHRIDLLDHCDETEDVFRDHINQKLQEPGSQLLARAGGLAAAGSGNSQFRCNATASEHFARLVTQAQGIFQYLETALKDIERGSTKLEYVAKLPKGLGPLYGDFFERKFGASKSSSYRRVRPVFDAIAASDGGVSETFLQNVLWLADPKAELHDVQERLKSVREFLRHIEGPQPAPAIDRSSSVLPECPRGHRMEKVRQTAERFCDLCGTTVEVGTVSFRCDDATMTPHCDYDICSACAVGSPLARAGSSSGITAEEPERLTFYHHSLGEWLKEEQDYRVNEEDGKRSLGVVQFAVLAKRASPETLGAFAAAAVEQLDCAKELKGMHLGRLCNRAQNDGVCGDVYALMSHLGEALFERGLDVHEFGKLLTDADIYVEEPCRWDGEWAHKRGCCRAAGDGDSAALKLFMAAGADLQCTAYPSPLHWAVKNNKTVSIGVLASLAGKGYTHETIPVAPGGRTPLHLAAQGRIESMSKLFACHIAGDINAADSIGMTALHVAAKGGYANELSELCDQGADLEAMEKLGWTALHVAAHEGQTEAERVLIEKGADVNARTRSKRGRFLPLHLACSKPAVQASVQMLCEAPNADLNARDASDWTALHWASGSGHLQAVRELLVAKADASLPTGTGATALHWACRCSAKTRLDVVNALLDAPAVDVHSRSDESGATPCMWACRAGHIDVVKRLCETSNSDAALSYTDSSGGGALHWAGGTGKHRVVAYLLNAGASVDARDQKGMTALHVAAKGYLPKSFDAETCRKSAAMNASYEEGAECTIRCLVKDFKADVSAKTQAGETALELAKERREAFEKALATMEEEEEEVDDVKQALRRQIDACTEVIDTLRRLSQ